MAGELVDNKGRGDVSWRWPAIHPEGRKFGLIAVAISLVFAFLAWETVAWPMAFLSLGVFAFFRDPEGVVPPDERAIGFTQIAGLIARRIVPFVKPGDTLAAGARVGLIRFGSRVDVYLPAGTDSKVLVGQKVVAGETVLAEVGERKLIEGIAQ